MERTKGNISTENDSFYCRPTRENVITKLGFATEEIYLRSQRPGKGTEMAARSKKETAATG